MLARGDSLVQEPQGSNTDYLSARAILEEPPVCAVEEDVGRESERDEYYAADAPEQPFMVEAPASETRNESPEAREPDHEKELEAIETETTRPLENAVPMPLDVAPVPQASEVSPAPTDTTNADIKKAKSKKTRGKETVPMVVSQIGETGRKRGRKKYVGASDDEDSRRKSHRKDSSEDSKAVTVADGGRLQPDAEVAQASAPNDPLPAPSLADAPAFPPLAESEDEPESQPVGIRRRVKAVPTWSDEDAEVEKPAPSEKPASLPAPIANSDQAPPEFLGEEKQEAEQTPAPAAVENSSRKGKVAKSGAVPAKRTSPRKASKSKQPVDLGVFEVPVTSSGASDDIASYGAEEKIEKPAKK